MAVLTPTASDGPLPSPLQTPNPHTPWHFSGPVFQRFASATPTGTYKKVEVQQQDPEFAFVLRYFQHNQPTNRAIKKVWAVHNWAQSNHFEGAIAAMEQQATNSVFKPGWEGKKDPLKPLRGVALKRWEAAVAAFPPFSITSQGAKQRGYQRAKVLPMWHGSSRQKCESICQSGFTFFGKHKGGKSQSTDDGFFGSGIYFTNSARYAADIYSDGEHLMLAWVSMRSPYPVVSNKAGQKCSDMQTLEGKGAYENYNAHYIPVISIKPGDPQCAIYYPCAKGEKPACDELVVFKESQTLATFWVEMCVDLPGGLSLKGPQADIDALVDLITKLLQTDAVKQNPQLVKALEGKFSVLISCPGSDPLSSDDLTYLNLAKRLVTDEKKVSDFVASRLLGSSSPQASAMPPTSAPLPVPPSPTSQPAASASLLPSPQQQLLPPTVSIQAQSSSQASPPLHSQVLAPKECLTIQGSKSELTGLVFSPVGQVIVSNDGKVVRLWSTSTAQEVASFVGDDHAVYCMAISPTGSRLAAGGLDHKVRLWDPHIRKVVAMIEHPERIRSIAFTADSTLGASGSESQMLRIWDGLTGQVVRTVANLGFSAESVAFNPSGTALAVGGCWSDYTQTDILIHSRIHIINPSTGQQTHTREDRNTEVTHVTFSPEGKYLTWVQNIPHDGYNTPPSTIRMWDVAGGSVNDVASPRSGLTNTPFSPDGKWFAYGTQEDKTIHLLDAKTRQEVVCLDYPHTPRRLAFSSDSRLLAVGGKTICIWNLYGGSASSN